MRRIVFRVLVLAALAISLIPARALPSMISSSRSDPLLFRVLEYFHHFQVCVNIWPFLFLQLLVCSLIPGLWGMLLLPGLAAGGLFAGLMACSSQGAGGILIIIMTFVFFGVPLVGFLLGSAAWAGLLALQRLLG